MLLVHLTMSGSKFHALVFVELYLKKQKEPDFVPVIVWEQSLLSIRPSHGLPKLKKKEESNEIILKEGSIMNDTFEKNQVKNSDDDIKQNKEDNNRLTHDITGLKKVVMDLSKVVIDLTEVVMELTREVSIMRLKVDSILDKS